MVEIGIDSFAATIPDPASGRTLPAADRMKELLAEVGTADRAGLDVFGIGEHHRKEFLDSALPPILAAAARIKRIRLTSAVRRDLSTLAHPKCTSRVTASVLWDKASRHVVSNESAEILRAWGVAR